MAMTSMDGSSQSFGGLTAQIGWFGLRVGGHPALRENIDSHIFVPQISLCIAKAHICSAFCDAIPLSINTAVYLQSFDTRFFLTHSFSVTPTNIAINNITLELHSLAYILLAYAAESILGYLQPLLRDPFRKLPNSVTLRRG